MLALARFYRDRTDGGAAVATAELDDALREAIDRGRCGQNAGVAAALTDEDFVRHLARHVPADERAVATLRALNAPDLFLACACLVRAPGAIEEFERRFLDALPALLASLQPSPAFVDEVRQTLSEKLLVGSREGGPGLASYSGRGALMAWFKVGAVRIALRMKKRAGERPHEGESAAERAVVRLDPELEFIKQRYRGDFTRAFEESVAALSPEQRNLLRLHFVDGLNIDKLGELLHLHRATVARRIATAREVIAEGTRQRLRDRLGLETAEFESLIALVRSRLEVSLGAALREEGGGVAR